jgi:hypothetical protein
VRRRRGKINTKRQSNKTIDKKKTATQREKDKIERRVTITRH